MRGADMAAADVKKVLQLKHHLKESCEGHTVGDCLSALYRFTQIM